MKKNDIKMETMEDVFKSISTTGKATTVGSLLGRANKIRKEEQKALALQQEKVSQEIKWNAIKQYVLADMKDSSCYNIIFATLIKKIDSLEKTVEDLRLSDSIHHMPLR